MKPSLAATAALWLSLVVPSVFVVQKYLGWAATAIYIVAAALGAAYCHRLSWPRTDRETTWLALATVALVAAAFLTLYPVVNVHTPGFGSDDDDAYQAGALALVSGHSPYLERTYLGNVLHQLPGAFILALPFVLLGAAALQNLFWLPIFFLAVRAQIGDGRAALRLAWLVLALSPTVMHQVVTGTGHAANTIYVLLGLWWLTRTPHRDWAAVAWGVALASRANFLFLLPLAFGWLKQNHGWPAAFRALLLTGATAACVTVPFYLYAPLDFGPFEANDRLLRFDALLPHLGTTLIAITAVLAAGLSLMPMTLASLLRNCAIVQAFPIILGTVLSTLQTGRADLAYAAYGSFFAWFGLMYYASAVMPQGDHLPSLGNADQIAPA